MKEEGMRENKGWRLIEDVMKEQNVRSAKELKAKNYKLWEKVKENSCGQHDWAFAKAKIKAEEYIDNDLKEFEDEQKRNS